MWRAKSLGGVEHLNWTTDTYLLAALVDALHAQAKGKKLRPSERVQRPEIQKAAEYRPSSVAEMNFGVLFGAA